ncbi:MAG: RusA family crossover junction endodeoxyribonuclease [Chloroflexota bacterium]|nr:RusA family crossover junction endodeoxyribonuclease [Chloroflexota bacterium]
MERGAQGTGETSSVVPTPAVLRLSLPLPPGVNNQYATVNGRRVLSVDARRFKSQVHDRITSMLHSGQLSHAAVEALRSSYLSLFIDFYFTSPMKRDLDGGLKIAQDALCETLGINDNRVVDIHLVKRIDPLNPRIDVQLETIAEEDWHFDEEYLYISTPGAPDNRKD